MVYNYGINENSKKNKNINIYSLAAWHDCSHTWQILK